MAVVGFTKRISSVAGQASSALFMRCPTYTQEIGREKKEWRLRYLHSKPQETLRRDCTKHPLHTKGVHAD